MVGEYNHTIGGEGNRIAGPRKEEKGEKGKEGKKRKKMNEGKKESEGEALD